MAAVGEGRFAYNALLRGYRLYGGKPGNQNFICRYTCESYDVSPITIIQVQGEYLIINYLIIIIIIIGQPTLYTSSYYYLIE